MHSWRLLAESDWVLSVVESGFLIPWRQDPAPLSLTPWFSQPPSSPVAAAALDEEVQALLAKRAVEELSPPVSPGFYGRIFVVPKATGGWRPVLDLSPLNRFVAKVHFKMETATSVRSAVQQNDWATSLDLRDAYFHVLMHPRSRPWLRFTWAKRVFQFRALPFGLSLSPWVFTRVTRELAIVLRRRGIRVRMYLDDWLVLSQSRETCLVHTLEVRQLAESLGFTLNLEKSDLNPAQSFVYLGMIIDTQSMTVRPGDKRLRHLALQLAQLRSQVHASARQLFSLLGSMESLAALVPLGRLFKRPLQRGLSQRWSPTRGSWDDRIQLGDWFLLATDRWLDVAWLSSGVPLVPATPQLQLFTDASSVGWGAHVEDLSAAGVWSAEQTLLHVNWLEMEAVRLALRAFQSFLHQKAVLLCTDNTTVACYLNKQGGARSISLSLKAEEILLWCQSHQVLLRARHVPGKLNIVADLLSRPHMVLNTEWTIAHSVLRPLWDLWFRPHVDLFATRFNHRLPVYVSPVPDPAAWAVDALSLNWEGLLAYAFPPFPILAQVLRKARLEHPAMILIAPRWPAQPWFPDLLALSHVPPVPLRIGPRDLLQPRSGIPHARPQVLHLHAWLLCGLPCAH